MFKYDAAKVLGVLLAIIAITATVAELHGRVVGRDQMLSVWYESGGCGDAR